MFVCWRCMLVVVRRGAELRGFGESVVLCEAYYRPCKEVEEFERVLTCKEDQPRT